MGLAVALKKSGKPEKNLSSGLTPDAVSHKHPTAPAVRSAEPETGAQFFFKRYKALRESVTFGKMLFQVDRVGPGEYVVLSGFDSAPKGAGGRPPGRCLRIFDNEMASRTRIDRA